MSDAGVTRRLAAIMAMDIAGYSRLMEIDEVGTLNALKAHRRGLVDPGIKAHHGRIVKTTGDGLLVEFASVIDAVSCAIDIQRRMIGRNAAIAADRRIVFRIGINVGDIISDGDDIFGDGVNVAARLEALCEPGGVCISRSANDQIRDRLSIAFDDLGERTVKNIARAIGVFGLGPDEITALPDGTLGLGGQQRPSIALAPTREQVIKFCKSADGTQIAYATCGAGPPLVKAPNWMSHLEFERQSPFWRHMLDELGRDHTLVRFDQRANGLSDWDVDTVSLDAFVADLETVVDTLGLERFPLLGVSQGCAISIAYTARHPERVSRLVLYGGFARGHFKRGAAVKEQAEAMEVLMRHGWGKDNPAFRQMFTTSFIPGATQEQMEWFNELQRISASAENAVRLRRAIGDFEVSDLLPRITVPTLVMHCTDDAIVPFSEGRRMAAGINGARFVALEGKNHLILENDQAWTSFLDEIRRFLAT